MNGMEGMDEETMAPQNFLYGCKLESGKDIVFNPEDDDFEHQLDLRMACVDATTKDEMHVVEVEAQDEEGQMVKAVLASLKPSTLPSVCLGGFTITPPAVFRLKVGSGPIHISGQHLVIMDKSFDDGEEEEEEEEEAEEDVPASKKRPATSPVAKNQKKLKKDVEEEEEDEDDDDDDEEDDDDEDDDEEDIEESPVPVKAKPAPKAKTPAQNGKSAKPTTPAKTPPKTPNKSPKAPKTPKKSPTIEEVKTQLVEFVKKGRVLPKIQPKFENLVKNAYKVTDAKVLEDLWKWKQTLKE